MNYLSILVYVLLCGFVSASAVRPVHNSKNTGTQKRRLLSTAREASLNEELKNNPLVVNSSDPNLFLKLLALRQDVQHNGCNINLCFVIQGDAYTDSIGFFDQITFADLVANILTTDETGGLCAVQYGSRTDVISHLTDRRSAFFERMDSAEMIGGFHSNIGGALGYVRNQLRPRFEDANKVVLFTDGMRTTGYPPAIVAQQLKMDGVEICAVGVGDDSAKGLKEIVQDDNWIFQINGYFEIIDVAENLVHTICDMKS